MQFKLKVGGSYIAEYGLSGVLKFTVLDITKTSIKVKWESGNEARYEINKFHYEHKILEELP